MISELIMATGGWSLTMREDAPREILDTIVPFSAVCVAPGRVTIGGASDASLLGQMRYVGVVTSPGPQRNIGGYGLAMMLGDSDGKQYDAGNASNLPDGPIGFSGTDITFWMDSIVAGTGLTNGATKVVNLAGGPWQWTATPRDILDWVVDALGIEWRINTDLSIDVDAYTVLYGSTPTAFITRRGQGREQQWTSVEGRFSSTVDVEDYTSKVWVLGPAGSASSGGSSPYYGLDGELLIIHRVVEASNATAGTEAAVAASILGLYSSPRRVVTLTTDLYDVAGEIGVGHLVNVFDEDHGLFDLTATSVPYRGRWVRPLMLRCTGLEWPVRAGMGVYGRAWDSTAGAMVWTDLTDYVVPEEGAATIRLGANRRWSER